MELDQILNDLQTSLDVVQSKLNILKTVQTGKLYVGSEKYTRFALKSIP